MPGVIIPRKAVGERIRLTAQVDPGARAVVHHLLTYLIQDIDQDEVLAGRLDECDHRLEQLRRVTRRQQAPFSVDTVGNGVAGFTLDPGLGEFMLTHPDIQVPADTREFAINASNSRFWEAPVKRYVDECLAGREGPRRQDFNMRWIASMVAEAHRILMRGGVFMYPRDTKDASKPGRLRLLYEGNPMAFLIEAAGAVVLYALWIPRFGPTGALWPAVWIASGRPRAIPHFSCCRSSARNSSRSSVTRARWR